MKPHHSKSKTQLESPLHNIQNQIKPETNTPKRTRPSNKDINFTPQITSNYKTKIEKQSNLTKQEIKIEGGTLKEKLLSGLVGIHVTFLEHCIDFFLAVIAGDLFDVLDRLPHTGWD